MQRGYLKLWRKIQDHRVYQNSDLLKLFLHLLMNANIVDKTWNGDLIKRGELACGREGLAKDLHESPSTIYKRLQSLAGPNYELITLRSNTQYTVVSIVNYDTYQPSKIEDGQQGNNEVTTVGQQGNTTKELKNKILDISGDPGSIRATKITLLKAEFDSIRLGYPGNRGGLTVEWMNFEKKNRNILELIVPLLAPAILREKEHKAALEAAGQLVPQWKHFSTWINKRCWEQEFSTVETNHGKNGSGWRGIGKHESAADKRESAAAAFERDLEARGNQFPNPPDVHVGKTASASEGLLGFTA